MKKSIVIFTGTFDVHADEMTKYLHAKGQEVIRLNTSDIPTNTDMSFNIDNGSLSGGIRNQLNGLMVDVDRVRSIWWRRPEDFCLPDSLSIQEREFAKLEIRHVLQGFWESVECYWISHPDNIRKAGFKLEQLKRAVEFGFEIPKTVITNNPLVVRDFYESCNGNVIYKVMSDPMLAASKIEVEYKDLDDFKNSPPPKVTHTTPVTKRQLEMLDSIRLAPCQFQEYIPKRLELRITIIGKEIFAAEIHSQDHEKTKIDWRHYDVQVPYRKANLPADIAERCLAFVNSYDLNYSALDFILTPDGRYVFLENNSNGQFMFLERQIPELKMRAALADCLIRGTNV
jgi:hypothetical protein